MTAVDAAIMMSSGLMACAGTSRLRMVEDLLKVTASIIISTLMLHLSARMQVVTTIMR
jgi:hypothetical protein